MDEACKRENGSIATLISPNKQQNKTLNVEIFNPLTNTNLSFLLAGKNSDVSKTDAKKIPKLNLKSAQVFITRDAGLAPARALKSAPPDGSTVSGDGGEVKQNLLKQEFSSRDTSILSGSRVQGLDYEEDIMEGDYDAHKLGGYPGYAQDAPEIPENYTFVLQIASESSAGFDIGDEGKYFFYYNPRTKDWRVHMDCG